METTGLPNLAAMFFRQAAARGDAPFVWRKREGAWRAVSWAEAAAAAAALAKSLHALGVKPGDRVVLVSESRPEWPIADIGIMAAGAIAVPTYVTNGVGDHLHVLTDSGAKGVIVSTAELAERVLPAAMQAPELRFVVAMENVRPPQAADFRLHRWATLLGDAGDALAEIAQAAEAIPRTGTACLIYTSGTGGTPKGVMLSHGAILSNCEGARKLLDELGLADEVFLSFLPLSHSYEHTAGLFFPISIGAQIYYAEGVDRLAANMEEVRPTLMTAVPRLYEVMHERILRGLRQAPPRAQRLFEKTLALGRARYEAPGSLGVADRLQDAVLTLLVRRKVAKRFGGRLKAMVSGGAPLNYDVGLFFTALGIRLLQGYGQTESAPVISCNPATGNKIEAVGPPLHNVEVRIADDGEILVRGELVMQGYWGKPEETAETIRDGWLHTGDVGELDEDGYLRITDRKKDIIVNSGGDNVSPQRIEGKLTLQPEIAQAMVYGDRRPHLVALIVPDEEFARSFSSRNGAGEATVGDLIDDAGFRRAISEAVERMNAGLSVIERVRRFTLTAEPFTVENELMTPTMKIRRHLIREKYGQALEALYRG
jgi:long-chain acyl-CoA synthetase